MREKLLIKIVFLLMVSSNDAIATSDSQGHGYERRVDLYLHKLRAKNLPSPESQFQDGTYGHPAILSPLIMQFLTIGETTRHNTQSTVDSDNKRQYAYNENAGIVVNPSKTADNSTSYDYIDDVGVPANINTIPTNPYQPMINDSSSPAVELLPTITTPFFDSITHAIVGEIQQHVQLIKPGTKWCGDGNKARSYEDVGVLYKTDKCCRTHDKCPHYILAHETKYGLHNEAHFTRSHCDCDASFYDCLKKVNSPFSTGVGITYFNLLKMKCFRYEYPVVMCSNMAGWFSKHCVEYIVDMRKQKQWQWFDNHEF